MRRLLILFSCILILSGCSQNSIDCTTDVQNVSMQMPSEKMNVSKIELTESAENELRSLALSHENDGKMFKISPGRG